MELRNRITGKVITENEFRSENVNTSFPAILTVEILNDFNYDPVLEGPQAVITNQYQYSQRDGVEYINGHWYTKYIAGPVFKDNNEQTAEELEAAYKSNKDKKQAESIRQYRNKLLTSTDWTQVYDAPVDKTAWAIYRQELRDITLQPGFPWDINWPVEP